MAVNDRFPFLRWSFWRLAIGLPSILRTGQVGDGREAAAVADVLSHAAAGALDAVIDTIDQFARRVHQDPGLCAGVDLPRLSPGV